MAKTHGGKRQGAGRKPRPGGPKRANFNAWISNSTRQAIESLSTDLGSISSAAEFLIGLGLKEMQKTRTSPATRYLCDLIGELQTVAAPVQLGPEFAWQSNPFMFEVYKLSIMKLMDALRPPGEIVAPLNQNPALKGMNEDIFGSLNSVKERAKHSVRVVLHNLARQPAPSLENIAENYRELSGKQRQEIFDLQYNLHAARSVLPPPPKQKTPRSQGPRRR